MEIDREDSLVEHLFFDLMLNDGVCSSTEYERAEKEHPQYFSDEKGFIPFAEHLDEIYWMPDIKGACAYILFLNNGRTYKGFTQHFKNRMAAHFSQKGGAKYTRAHRPLYILHYVVLSSRGDALRREKYFKTLSGMDKIKNTLGELNTVYPPVKSS